MLQRRVIKIPKVVPSLVVTGKNGRCWRCGGEPQRTDTRSLSYGSDAAIRCWRGDPRHLKQILNAAAADAQRHERKDRQGAALCRVQNQERRVAKKNRMRGDTPGGGRGRIACCKRASVCEGLVGCKHFVPSVLRSCGPGGWAGERLGLSPIRLATSVCVPALACRSCPCWLPQIARCHW